jgi:hypothetical protein
MKDIRGGGRIVAWTRRDDDGIRKAFGPDAIDNINATPDRNDTLLLIVMVAIIHRRLFA